MNKTLKAPVIHPTSSIAVIGAGAWGTALGAALARNGVSVRIFGDNTSDLKIIANKHQNPTFFGDFDLPKSLLPAFSLEDALKDMHDILMVVPSHVFRLVLRQMKPYLKPGTRMVWATKGLDPETHDLLHKVVEEELGPCPMAVISGPSFAAEVVRAIPTAVALSGNHPEFNADLIKMFNGEGFYVKPCDDMIGMQLAGAIKNIIAIACGMSDGLGFGSNTRAAIITQGLAQIAQLGIAMGAKAETFSGLAGLGDLVLTCTDDQSRNRRFGLLLGQGMTATEALKTIGQTVEGMQNIEQVPLLSQKYQMHMPIVDLLVRVLNQTLTPHLAVCEMLV